MTVAAFLMGMSLPHGDGGGTRLASPARGHALGPARIDRVRHDRGATAAEPPQRRRQARLHRVAAEHDPRKAANIA